MTAHLAAPDLVAPTRPRAQPWPLLWSPPALRAPGCPCASAQLSQTKAPLRPFPLYQLKHIELLQRETLLPIPSAHLGLTCISLSHDISWCYRAHGLRIMQSFPLYFPPTVMSLLSAMLCEHVGQIMSCEEGFPISLRSPAFGLLQVIWAQKLSVVGQIEIGDGVDALARHQLAIVGLRGLQLSREQAQVPAAAHRNGHAAQA